MVLLETPTGFVDDYEWRLRPSLDVNSCYESNANKLLLDVVWVRYAKLKHHVWTWSCTPIAADLLTPLWQLCNWLLHWLLVCSFSRSLPITLHDSYKHKNTRQRTVNRTRIQTLTWQKQTLIHSRKLSESASKAKDANALAAASRLELDRPTVHCGKLAPALHIITQYTWYSVSFRLHTTVRANRFYPRTLGMWNLRVW